MKNKISARGRILIFAPKEYFRNLTRKKKKLLHH